MSHMLVIPTEGVLHMMHVLEGQTSTEVLGHFQTEGAPAQMQLPEEQGTLHFIVNEEAPLNTRAREIVADLFGVHIIFTGPVGLTGLPEEKVVEAIKAAGR